MSKPVAEITQADAEQAERAAAAKEEAAMQQESQNYPQEAKAAVQQEPQNAPQRFEHARPRAKDGSISPPRVVVLPNHGGLISSLNDNDVLSGRGGRTNNHPGNIAFRNIVKGYRHEYLDPRTRKLEKAHVAARLVAQIRSMNPPGRFLKEDSENRGMYVEIGDQKALRSECSLFLLLKLFAHTALSLFTESAQALREEPVEEITIEDAEMDEKAAAAKAAVQQEPQNSLQHVEHASVLPPYGYPNAYYGEPMQTALEEPPAKRPKSYNILSEHEKKKILFYYFSDGSAPSLRSYCQTQNISNAVYQQLQYLINKHPVLKDMQDKIGEMAVRNDAMSYINMNLPGPSVLPKAQAKKDFFTVNNIHDIATSLDFEEEPRMSRNGKKEIPIHDKHEMDERTRSLAMIMIQMVIANTPKK